MSLKSRGRIIAAVGAAAGAVLAAGTSAAAAVPHPSTLQRDAAAARAAGEVGVVAELDDGRRTSVVRAGRATLGSDRPVPRNAEFRIGSASKTFVGTVLLQLVGEGRLSLDDSVDRWLPGVVSGNGNDGRKITVRELMQHTSGIFSYTDDQEFDSRLASAAGYRRNWSRSYSPEQLVSLAMRHKPNFAPGTSWSYSNTNYILVGMIVDRVTGRSWQHEINTRIIAPLGLKSTHIPGNNPFLGGPHANGYEQFPDAAGPTDVTRLNSTLAGSAGELVSTTTDLNRFFRALVGGELIGPAQLREMERTVAVPPDFGAPAGFRYGLGLAWQPLSCGGGYWGHPGDVLGYHTMDGVTPDGKRSVTVSMSGPASDSASDAAETLVDDALCGK